MLHILSIFNGGEGCILVLHILCQGKIMFFSGSTESAHIQNLPSSAARAAPMEISESLVQAYKGRI